VLSQFHAISYACFKGSWANLMTLASSLKRGPGLTQSYQWHHFGATVGHQQCVVWQVLGQFHAIGDTSFEGSRANPMPLTLPLQIGTGPTQTYWQHQFDTTLGHQQHIVWQVGQFHAIVNAHFEQCWAISMASAASPNEILGHIETFNNKICF
jgi:hypothetical protein